MAKTIRENIERVGKSGVENFGISWLGANEAAVNVGWKLGLKAQENQLPMMAGVFAGLLYAQKVVYVNRDIDLIDGGGI